MFAQSLFSLAMARRSGRMDQEGTKMDQRPVYDNTFNQAAIIERRYRWIALVCSLLVGALLTAYLLE